MGLAYLKYLVFTSYLLKPLVGTQFQRRHSDGKVKGEN